MFSFFGMSKRPRSPNEDTGSNDGSKRLREENEGGDSNFEEGNNTNDNDLFKIETEGPEFATSSWNLEEGDVSKNLMESPFSVGDTAFTASASLAPQTDSDLHSNPGSETSVDEDSPLEELFAAVMTAQDESGRSISQIFQLLPSKEDYPDYYSYIKEPIDLKMIGTKIQCNAYSSLSNLEKDLMLLVKNAKYYNEPGSQVYKDANFLRRIILGKKSEIEQRKYQPLKTSERIKAKKYTQDASGQKWSAIASNLKYDSVPTGSANQSFLSGDDHEDNDSDPEDAGENPMYMVFEAIRSYADDAGNIISGPFMRLPNRRFYPDYYLEIKDPISLSQIQQRIKGNMYRDAGMLIKDFNQMFENAKRYNRPDSKIFENTCILQKLMYEKVKECLGWEEKGKEGKDNEEGEMEVDNEIEGDDDEDDDEADEEENIIDAVIDDSSKVSLTDDIPVLQLEDIIKTDTDDNSLFDASQTSFNDTLADDTLNSTLLNTSTISSTLTPSKGFSVTITKKTSKRLVTGYIIFASEVRKSVVQRNPDCNFGDISRIIGSEWKNLPTEVKAEYEKKAQKQNEVTAAAVAKEAQLNPPASLKQVIVNAVYECHWEQKDRGFKCDFQCEDTEDLLEHLTAEPNGHVWTSYGDKKDIEDNIFQCLFHGCGRVKKGAAPFPSVIRLIRHIKEVHVTKQNPKSIPPEKRGKNFHQSKSTVMYDAPKIHVQDPNNNLFYSCLWENKCSFQCQDSPLLLEHLINEPNGHVWRSYGEKKDVEDNIFQCLFHGCGRVKKGAAPFPNITRLIRHVKEIHVTKQRPKPIERKNESMVQTKNVGQTVTTVPLPPQVVPVMSSVGPQSIQQIIVSASPSMQMQVPLQTTSESIFSFLLKLFRNAWFALTLFACFSLLLFANICFFSHTLLV